jgi:uracil-DNA glycosylase
VFTREDVVPLLGESWADLLWNEFNQEYMRRIMNIVRQERATFDVYPSPENVFKAYQLTPFEKARVVIIGQDPYHTPGMATGLAFSVPGYASEELITQTPPSLSNIFKELEDDLGFKQPSHNPDLSRWARQGVFLLNTTLTVRGGNAGSHSNIGWDIFTRRTTRLLGNSELSVSNAPRRIFVLWGNHAKGLKDEIDPFINRILESSHPSPMGGACFKGFFGSKPFSKINDYLDEPIDWYRDE